jgi:hypothetical protein
LPGANERARIVDGTPTGLYAAGWREMWRANGRGVIFRVWEPDMSRIPKAILDCAVYLYGSEAAARSGESAGGSGFLVGLESTKHKGMWWIYAVTNGHVIKHGYPVVRLNKREQGRGNEIEVLNLSSDQWIHHPDGDDLAICPIEVFGKHIKFQFLDVRNHFVTRNEMPFHDLGPGSDVYMVGRLVQRGIQRNLPIVHTGVIAMMPLEPLERDDGFLQETFIVECRSIGGFSGSPVFVRGRRDELSDISFPTPGPASDYRQWLLGVNWCHIHEHLEDVYTVTKNNELKNTPYRVRSNSGFAGVIPAWKLSDLIDGDIARAMREADEKAMTIKKAKSGITLDSAKGQPSTPRTQKSRAGKDIPIPTEREVTDFFKKATRKRTPS